jgi:hypothetical protein
MSITFEVIDTVCTTADQSFFVPNVVLTTQSTTQYETLFGYNEFGTPSSPPKKYRKVTVSGYSKRIAFTAEQTPRQCAGGKYVWSGVGEYDLKGNIIQRYRKDFYAQCAKQFWPNEGLQTLPGEVNTSVINAQLVAFCWPDMHQSCAMCDPDETNWPFLGNQAVGNLLIDFAGFRTLPSDVITTNTVSSVGVIHNDITNILTGQPFTWEIFGGVLDSYIVQVGSTTYTARPVITDPPQLVFPAVALSSPSMDSFTFVVQQYVNYTDSSFHSAILSEEYTDADAQANPTTVLGTSATAQTLPRTTGFTTINTSVVFTLLCANLISGRNYTVTVDFWERATVPIGPPFSQHTPKTYNFTASGSTNTIVDTVPTPVGGHTITVQKPIIAFS